MDDKPQPPATKKNIFYYFDEINFWVEEKIHEKWKANKCNMMSENGKASRKHLVVICAHFKFNDSDDDVSILEVTSRDQLKGDKYSKIMGAVKPGRIRGVGSTIENMALRDYIKKMKEGQVDIQNNMQKERLQMEKTVDQMKNANEESLKKIDALLLLLTGRLSQLHFVFLNVLPHPDP
ncbi:hypothetical protein MKX01_032454 [Papaver californicum]|nr:hypothetical protein MKX01_032454 [Papaver californicum]